MIASLCIEFDVICISDEVYEWLIYPGAQHQRIASLPGQCVEIHYVAVSSGIPTSCQHTHTKYNVGLLTQYFV